MAESLEHWEDQLRALDHGPSYVNGMPVRALPCTPPRFEVTRFFLTSGSTGLGSFAWLPFTWILTLHEAAAFVARGCCPHFKQIKGSLRYTDDHTTCGHVQGECR